jgi:hypoxanthine phosphoribosyltransferase
MVTELGDKILSNPPRPTLFVPVPRGGANVGNLLSDYICGRGKKTGTNERTYEIIPIRCRTWSNKMDGHPPTDEDFEALQELPLQYKDLSKEDVLGVDDVLDTGVTWYQLKRRIIEPAKPRSFRVSALHVKNWTKYEPDFCVERVPHEWWIFYPWEKREVTESALEKLLKIGYSYSDAIKTLRDSFEYLYGEQKTSTVDRIFEQATVELQRKT